MANNRSKQLLKEHFQELEGEREVNSSGSDDEEDEDQVRKRKWAKSNIFFLKRQQMCLICFSTLHTISDLANCLGSRHV